jgi:hypothetical protein
MAEEMSGDSLSIGPAFDKLWEDVEGELAKGPLERARLDRRWMEEHTENGLLRLHLVEPEPLLVREGVMRARLRLAQAVILDRVGKKVEAAAVLDPFTGRALHWGAGVVYSVGPDGVDNGGRVAYQPTAGIHSEGDLVAELVGHSREEDNSDTND